MIRVESEETQDDVRKSAEEEENGGGEDFETKCGWGPAEKCCFVVTSSAARSHSATGSWRLC